MRRIICVNDAKAVASRKVMVLRDSERALLGFSKNADSLLSFLEFENIYMSQIMKGDAKFFARLLDMAGENQMA
jgi:hypothetical protein